MGLDVVDIFGGIRSNRRGIVLPEPTTEKKYSEEYRQKVQRKSKIYT